MLASVLDDFIAGLTSQGAAQLSLVSLAVNLVIGAILTSLLAWHHVRFGRTLANRRAFAANLMFVGLTTILIISIVKSSLALSLGLVGALSIVRFRTPIKEPEELAYLFLSIAIGLGLGADQRPATLLATVVILGLLTLRSVWRKEGRAPNLYLNVEVTETDDAPADPKKIVSIIEPHVRAADMRRMDVQDGVLTATFFLDCRDDTGALEAVESLRRELPGCNVSFIDQQTHLGL
jgi:uncharacterized membrane protein YhiD involved in acid resistance